MFQNNFWLNNPDHGVFLADLDCGGIIENLAELWRNYNVYKAQQFPAKDTKKGSNERQINAVMFVKKEGRITNRKYQDLFKVSRQTASRELSHLAQKGIFKQVGVTGKGTYYTLVQTPHKRLTNASKGS